MSRAFFVAATCVDISSVYAVACIGSLCCCAPPPRRRSLHQARPLRRQWAYQRQPYDGGIHALPKNITVVGSGSSAAGRPVHRSATVRSRRAASSRRVTSARGVAYNSIAAATAAPLTRSSSKTTPASTAVVWGRKMFVGLFGRHRTPTVLHAAGTLGAHNHHLAPGAAASAMLDPGRDPTLLAPLLGRGHGGVGDEDAANRRFHTQQKYNARDAVRHFDDMVRLLPAGAVPSVAALNSLLRVFTNARWVKRAETCLAKFQEYGVPYDMGTYFALIEMYCSVRQVDSAIKLIRYAEAPQLAAKGKDAVLFNRALRTIANTLSREHRHGECLHLLRACKPAAHHAHPRTLM